MVGFDGFGAFDGFDGFGAWPLVREDTWLEPLDEEHDPASTTTASIPRA